MKEIKTLLSGLGFGESPRWHDDRLWFPFSIDWMPDGRRGNAYVNGGGFGHRQSRCWPWRFQ